MLCYCSECCILGVACSFPDFMDQQVITSQYVRPPTWWLCIPNTQSPGNTNDEQYSDAAIGDRQLCEYCDHAHGGTVTMTVPFGVLCAVRACHWWLHCTLFFVQFFASRALSHYMCALLKKLHGQKRDHCLYRSCSQTSPGMTSGPADGDILFTTNGAQQWTLNLTQIPKWAQCIQFATEWFCICVLYLFFFFIFIFFYFYFIVVLTFHCMYRHDKKLTGISF